MALLVGETFASLDGEPSCHEFLVVAPGVLDVPPPHTIDVGVCTRPHAPPVMSEPVAHVVSAAVIAPGAGASPVGDLIVDESCLGEHLLGDEVLVGQIVLVGHGQFATAYPSRESGSLLDDERVGGQVVHIRLQGRFEAGSPRVDGFPGSAEDEVERDVVESHLTGQTRHVHRPLRGVVAIQQGQDALVGGLHAHGQSIDAPLEQPVEHLGVQGFRIGLGRHLGIRAQTPQIAHMPNELTQLRGAKHGGGAPAEEHRAHRGHACTMPMFVSLVRVYSSPRQVRPNSLHAVGQMCCCQVQLAVCRGKVVIHRSTPHRREYIGVEVAVAAPTRAERHVQIDPPRLADCELDVFSSGGSRGSASVAGAEISRITAGSRHRGFPHRLHRIRPHRRRCPLAGRRDVRRTKPVIRAGTRLVAARMSSRQLQRLFRHDVSQSTGMHPWYFCVYAATIPHHVSPRELTNTKSTRVVEHVAAPFGLPCAP